jgi:Fic family protein
LLCLFIRRDDFDLIVSNDIIRNLLKTISTATASRDLKQGVEKGLLKPSGDKRTSVYRLEPIKK